MTKATRALLVVLLCAGASALGLAPAAAAGTGLLRLAHLSPDTPAVDVYVDAVADSDTSITLPGVGYGTVSPYQSVPAGSYTVSMRAAGADPASPPVLSTTVQVDEGSARTVAGVGYFASLGLEIIDDSLALPASGSSRVRVISAAASASPLDVALTGGSTLADGLAFAKKTNYVDVPGGSATLQVGGGTGEPTDLSVDLAAGSVYTVLVLDRPGGGLTLQMALDAASPGVVPVGGVETGLGGTAGSEGSPWVVPVGIAVVAAVAAGAMRVTTARRTSSSPRHAAGS
jgi:hypothetical protein